MSVLIDKNTRLIVQGITGREGGFHALQAVKYGTNAVGGDVAVHREHIMARLPARRPPLGCETPYERTVLPFPPADQASRIADTARVHRRAG